jgi:hypothetical protein
VVVAEGKKSARFCDNSGLCRSVKEAKLRHVFLLSGS